MSNGNDMTDRATFRKKMEELKTKNELDLFIAEEVYTIRQNCPACQLKKVNNLALAGAGGGAAGFVAFIIWLLQTLGVRLS